MSKDVEVTFEATWDPSMLDDLICRAGRLAELLVRQSLAEKARRRNDRFREAGW